MTAPDGAAPRSVAMAYREPGDLPRVRAFAQQQAERFGLAPEQAASLTIAVSELVTNTLQHTTGGGEVRIRVDHDWLTCDVVDGGPLRVFGRPMPAADAIRGRGLAIVERVCDEVSAISGTDGTTVRMRFAIDPRPDPA